MTFIFIIIFLLFALYHFMECMDPDGGCGWIFRWLRDVCIDGIALYIIYAIIEIAIHL